MDVHRELLEQLDALTELLDGTDLRMLLQALEDELRASVPGFLGLDLTVMVHGEALTLSTMGAGTEPIRASLTMPLDGPTSPLVTYYASVPGVFTGLAADALIFRSRPELVVVDGHLTADGERPGVIGLAELVVLNQRIGELIEQGFSIDQARAIVQGDAR